MSLFDIFKRKAEDDKVDDNSFRIEDRGYEKVLKYGGITYSKLKSGSLYTQEYWDYFTPLAYLFNNPRVLIIGLGGGTVGFQLETLLQGRVKIDALDVSNRALEIFKGFVPKTRINAMIGDGAEYVRKTDKKYDMVVLDAYVSARIPQQFMEKQFIDDVYNSLSENGILAINYVTGFMGMMTFYEYAAKLKGRFLVFRLNTALTEGNAIIVCSKKMGKYDMLQRINQSMKKSEDNSFLFKNYEEMKQL